MKQLVALTLAIAASVGSAATAFAQDPAAGENVFKKCRACHQIGEGAKSGVGPQLNGLIGRPSGSVAGYKYSEANKNSGVTWTEDAFKKYIADPRGFMPGNRMAFAGLKDAKEIDDLVAYLKQYGPDGKKM
jgi:cytochrome c